MAVLGGNIGWRARWLFLLCCLATAVLYPFRYHDLLQFQWWAIGLLNARNILLVVLFAYLIAGPERTRGANDLPDAQQPRLAQGI